MILKTKLKKILDNAGKTQIQFSDESGISAVTLSKIYNDSWSQIQRRTIEKICQSLGIGVGELFDLESESMWERLMETGHVDIITGGRISGAFINLPDGDINRMALGYWDLKAWSELLIQLGTMVPRRIIFDIHVFPAKISMTQSQNNEYGSQIEAILSSGNTCIIIGSPKTNAAFDICYKNIIESKGNKEAKPPYVFNWFSPDFPEDTRISFSLYSVEDATQQGLYDTQDKGLLRTAPMEIMRKKLDQDLPDAGIIMGCLDYRNTNTTVIMCGGLGGPATLGCARALLQNSSELERFLHPEKLKSFCKPVFVRFRKMTDTAMDDRKITGTYALLNTKQFMEATEEARSLITS